MRQIKLIVFDMAGTTVKDQNNVHLALQTALHNFGINVSIIQINPLMGYPKPLAIKMLAEMSNVSLSEDMLNSIHSKFVDLMIEHYTIHPDIAEKDNAKQVFAQLKNKGIKVAIDTGFSRPIADTIFNRLNWLKGEDIDYSVTSDEVKQGRPYPYMIFKAMEYCNIQSVEEVMKVGDTSSDLEQGTNAGCKFVVGVTSGAFAKSELIKYPHTHLVETLNQIFEILG